MASNSLSGAGVSPANTKDQLLHIGTGTLGAGAVVRLGNGTATPLTISSGGVSVAGTFGVSGVLTFGSVGNPLTFSSEDNLSGAGAVPVNTALTKFTSTGASQALTLANGVNGQVKTIVHVVDGGSGVLTPTTKTGYNTITFSGVGDAVTLMYLTTLGWVVMGFRNVTFA